MKVVVQRYASALADVALAQGLAEQVKRELGDFVALMTDSADFRNFLVSPAVPPERKRAVVEKVVERMGASRALRNFVFVLVDNRRAALLPQIREAYAAQLHARLCVSEAQVTSARELTAAERAQLLKTLEQMTGMKVEARYALDPGLIGGAVVRIGSTIYDGSVREQLNRLRVRLAAD
jgi:F-type H+-transporting ATPase subunit delta